MKCPHGYPADVEMVDLGDGEMMPGTYSCSEECDGGKLMQGLETSIEVGIDDRDAMLALARGIEMAEQLERTMEKVRQAIEDARDEIAELREEVGPEWWIAEAPSGQLKLLPRLSTNGDNPGQTGD